MSTYDNENGAYILHHINRVVRVEEQPYILSTERIKPTLLVCWYVLRMCQLEKPRAC